MRGVFVTGTDTGVGKTVLAAAICAALAARGERVRAFKPVVTGTDEAPEPDERGVTWPADHELLATAAGGVPAADVAPLTFGPAVSPHLAAELAGRPIEPAGLAAAARRSAAEGDVLVCEGVGGLLVPITPGYLVRDLAMELGMPIVVAARPGLGTINHTLLTLEAARAAGLDVRGVVMTPWPQEPSVMERSNRDTVARLGGVPVEVLPATAPASLAPAGEDLPLDAWIGAGTGA